MSNPFRYFNSSPEVIRLVVMMYVRHPLSRRNVEDFLVELRGFKPRTSAVLAPARTDGATPSGCTGPIATAAPLDPALEWPCFT